MRIDAHQHFWNYNPVRDSWIGPGMEAIQRDFLPSDLLPLLQQSNIDGCVAVQADQSEEETDFLLSLAEENSFVKGVVGWVDLRSNLLEEKLAAYAAIPHLKGFRHIVQSEPDGFLTHPDFVKGVQCLNRFNFTYDLLIYPNQLREAGAFVGKLPDQRIVIDHLAKPKIRQHEIQKWKKELVVLASFENVCCKLSGLVTEADWNHWGKKDLLPYIDTALELFGADRLMFGSDWPVCLLAAPYSEVVDLVDGFLSKLSKEEKDKIMGRNAIRFYNL